MASLTVMLCFQLDSTKLEDEETLMKIEGIGKICLPTVTEVLIKQHSLKEQFLVMYVWLDSNGSHVMLRLQKCGLMTVDVDEYVKGGLKRVNPIKTPWQMEDIKELRFKITQHLGDLCSFSQSLNCPIRRSSHSAWRYLTTGDQRLMERDFTDLVFEKNSKHQNIKIFKSREQGNVLYLDDDVMHGENDSIYFHSILRIGQNDYSDKRVLILGGGVGALLHELLKQKPKFIHVVEIDEEVIKACQTHMRKICGRSIDKLQGENYKIEIGDCVDVVKNLIDKGETFDYVIDDVSDFYVCQEEKGFAYEYEKDLLLLESTLKLTALTGKFLIGLDSEVHAGCLKIFLQQIRQLGYQYDRIEAYVPSFGESFCFIQVFKLTSD